MIKILFYIETLKAGGAEKVLCNLVNNMDLNEFDITVQTYSYVENYKDYLSDGIKYKYIVRNPGTIDRYKFRIELALGMVYRKYIRDDYDIEVAYLETSPTKVIAQSTNENAVKLAWVHCDIEKNYKEPEELYKKTKEWYSKFDKVICVSENVRESFVKYFKDTVDTEVVVNTIDDKEIIEKAVEPLSIEKKKKVVAAVGRLSFEKGMDRLIEAVKKLCDEGHDFETWIIGDGPLKAELEEYIHSNNLDDQVKILGFRSNPYPFMKTADIIVCPSRNEGFSTVVAEGLILGKPIVATDCAGMCDLLGDSEYGLITENSTDGIYNGLKKLLCSEAYTFELTQRAQERSVVFSGKYSAGETENFLKKQIKENKN